MKMRMVLLSSCRELDGELDDGAPRAVPVDLLEERVLARHITSEDFENELQAALHEGDLEEIAPGMVALTQAGTRHFSDALQLK